MDTLLLIYTADKVTSIQDIVRFKMSQLFSNTFSTGPQLSSKPMVTPLL